MANGSSALPPAALGEIGDARDVLVYLVVPESDQYILIMDVLEQSVNDLTPSDVFSRLLAASTPIPEDVVESRLDKLREWRAVSARPDASRIFRHSDILARNWRYSATPVGRQVQRFYRKVLLGTPALREIPLPRLADVVDACDALVSSTRGERSRPEMIARLFVNHDDLDSALVGAEDSLTGLVDRFDLSDESTGELKALLVNYATRVAAELERGSARAFRALNSLRGEFEHLAMNAVQASDARILIERGALLASRGGAVGDWNSLLDWFDPSTGRAARFAHRLVRALPGMHLNLRRLHSSSGTATSRSRAVALARACANPQYGTAVMLAALGDHSWRKLYGDADDSDLPRIQSWRGGAQVAVPELLRATGRAGARGRASAGRDDASARVAVAMRRAIRAAEHSAAMREVLSSRPGSTLSEQGARVALTSLCAAIRTKSVNGRRTAVSDGLACSLFHVEFETGIIKAPKWRALTPGRIPVFHLPGTAAGVPDHKTTRSESVETQLLVVGARE